MVGPSTMGLRLSVCDLRAFTAASTACKTVLLKCVVGGHAWPGVN